MRLSRSRCCAPERKLGGKDLDIEIGTFLFTPPFNPSTLYGLQSSWDRDKFAVPQPGLSQGLLPVQTVGKSSEL